MQDALCLRATGEVLLRKPFVEKPANAENHDIVVYFASDSGGGCQQLFRKSKDRSSTFVPGDRELRSCTDRGGSYMYEEFVATGGTDIKVYTVPWRGWAGQPAHGQQADAVLNLILEAVIATNDLSVFQAMSVQALLSWKWKAFARDVYLLMLLVYVLGVVATTLQARHAQHV